MLAALKAYAPPSVSLASWISLGTSQLHKERKVREKLSAADALEGVETSSELEICYGVELEASVSQTRRVRRHVDFERGARLGLVTFADEWRLYGLGDGLGTYHMGLGYIYEAEGPCTSDELR